MTFVILAKHFKMLYVYFITYFYRLTSGYSWVIPTSQRRRGATAVLVRHKPQWHHHDRRGSAVVPSLIAVAPRKTQNHGPSRWHGGNFEHIQNFRSATAVGPIRSGIAAAPTPWHRTRTAVAPPSPPQYNRRAIA